MSKDSGVKNVLNSIMTADVTSALLHENIFNEVRKVGQTANQMVLELIFKIKDKLKEKRDEKKQKKESYEENTVSVKKK